MEGSDAASDVQRNVIGVVSACEGRDKVLAISDPTAQTATVLEGHVGGFPASYFIEDAFDSQEFVAKARRSMPLDDLLSELQAHLLKLRESLVDTINQDYTAFVGMASNLKGLDEALSRVRSPLETLRMEIDELRAAAAQAVTQLGERIHYSALEVDLCDRSCAQCYLC